MAKEKASVDVAAAGRELVIAANAARRIICVQNSGANRMWFGFGTADEFGDDPAAVVDDGVGFFLEAGASRVMKVGDWPEIVEGLYSFSTAGSTAEVNARTAS